MFPVIDGWTLLAKIRQMNIQTHILCLTAKDMVEDQVKGLELGADDYLIKAVAFTELLARLRDLLRRNQPQMIEQMSFADFSIDILYSLLTKKQAFRIINKKLRVVIYA